MLAGKQNATGLLASRRSGAVLPRAAGAAGAGRRALVVRAVLGMNKAKASTNGKLDATAVEDDVKRELRYRVAAADASDPKKLYQSVAWSVHNRLVDAFNETHEHWK